MRPKQNKSNPVQTLAHSCSPQARRQSREVPTLNPSPAKRAGRHEIVP